ncbi:MAG: hypothetical protein ACOYMN_20785, partial [Roseimicrobium sp.]
DVGRWWPCSLGIGCEAGSSQVALSAGPGLDHRYEPQAASAGATEGVNAKDSNHQKRPLEVPTVLAWLWREGRPEPVNENETVDICIY